MIIVGLQNKFENMKKIFFLLLLIYSFKTFSLELTISQGTIKPTPIAITDLYAINNSTTKIGKNISMGLFQIIWKDLVCLYQLIKKLLFKITNL